MTQDFFSTHAIDENIEFIPMYHQQLKHGISNEKRYGMIVAVRFTKPKVFYDILDEYYATIFENVDSAKVFSLSPVTELIPENTSPNTL